MSFALDLVYPYVLPSAKSAGPGALDTAIISAADTLLRLVPLWQVVLAPVQTVASVVDYPLDPYIPADSAVTKLVGWAMDGIRYKLLTQAEDIQRALEPGGFNGNAFFDGPTDDAPAYAPAAYLVTEGTVRVLPAPVDGNSAMVFAVNLTVPNTASTLPDCLAPYVRLVGAGALSILQSTPNKDYTDLSTGQINLDRFNDGVGSLTIRAERAFGAATVRRRARAY